MLSSPAAVAMSRLSFPLHASLMISKRIASKPRQCIVSKPVSESSAKPANCQQKPKGRRLSSPAAVALSKLSLPLHASLMLSVSVEC